MCKFFSFVTLGDGKLKYFTAEEREKMSINDSPDSHTYIAQKKTKVKCGPDQGKDDLVNKYEYVDGRLIVDQINVKNDKKLVKKEIAQFVTTEKFEKICLLEIKRNFLMLDTIKEQTPEICLAALEQSGWALEFIRKQTPEMCLKAVKEDGSILQFVQKQTPEICLAAVQQNKQALRFVKDSHLRRQLDIK